jgi:hypothetical protein
MTCEQEKSDITHMVKTRHGGAADGLTVAANSAIFLNRIHFSTLQE